MGRGEFDRDGTLFIASFGIVEKLSREQVYFTVRFVLFNAQETICRERDDVVEHLGGGGTAATVRKSTEL